MTLYSIALSTQVFLLCAWSSLQGSKLYANMSSRIKTGKLGIYSLGRCGKPLPASCVGAEGTGKMDSTIEQNIETKTLGVTSEQQDSEGDTGNKGATTVGSRAEHGRPDAAQALPLQPNDTSEESPISHYVSDDDQIEWYYQQEKALYDARREYYFIQKRRTRAVTFGVPLLIVSLLVVMLLIVPFLLRIEFLWTEALGLFDLFNLGSDLIYWTSVVITWSVIVFIAAVLYYVNVTLPLRSAKSQIKEVEETIQLRAMAVPEQRREILQNRLNKLSSETAQVFFDNPKSYTQARVWREEAERELGNNLLSEAQSKISAIDELVARERRSQRDQRNWQYAAIFVMLIYICFLGIAVIFGTWVTDWTPLPIFGVPITIIMWAAAGSLAAILYRFYNEEGKIRFASELRWLIARPIIGIIMGGVTFLAVTSGLVLMGAGSGLPEVPVSAEGTATELSEVPVPAEGTATEETVTPVSAARIEVLWIIAFLAGFSDKFYVGIINLLVDKTFGGTAAKDKSESGEENIAKGQTDQENKATLQT
jgi:hypothetical protein